MDDEDWVDSGDDDDDYDDYMNNSPLTEHPPGTKAAPTHQNKNMVEWWYKWRKVNCDDFFLNMKKIVSMNSINLEK